jgi:hypothetical protein
MTNFILALALTSTCQTYSVRCVCYPAIPFEGFQGYVTEKCDGLESSYPYGKQMYDTQELCEEAQDKDPNCQSLKN